ncbi:hypothetical protein ACHAXT_007654 [Thalassiosira profunda]
MAADKTSAEEEHSSMSGQEDGAFEGDERSSSSDGSASDDNSEMKGATEAATTAEGTTSGSCSDSAGTCDTMDSSSGGGSPGMKSSNREELLSSPKSVAMKPPDDAPQKDLVGSSEEYDYSTVTSCPGARDEQSHATNFSAHDNSIQSDLMNGTLKDGDESTQASSHVEGSIQSEIERSSLMGSLPSHAPTSKPGPKGNDDVSSLTMDSHPATARGKSRGFVGSMKLGVRKMAKKKGRGRGKRRDNKLSHSDSSSEGNPHTYRRRSQSEAAQRKRQRDRSRSIVRDARSFLDSIDGMEGVRTEDAASVVTGSSPIEDEKRERAMGLLSNLREANPQSEETIRALELQLTDLANERNAFRINGERVMEVMTKQKSELEKELRHERKGFADASHSHKLEMEEWAKRAWDAERKAMKVEGELKAKQGMQGMEGPLEGEAEALAFELGIDMGAPASDDVQRAILRLAEVETRYTSQAKQLQADNVRMKAEVDGWKDEHARAERKRNDLLKEREEEAVLVDALEKKLEHFRQAIESMKRAGAADAGTIVNDELVTKLGDLADENGRLLSKCQQLEQDSEASRASAEDSLRDLAGKLEASQRENEEGGATIELLEVENRNLRESLESQGETSKKMKGLVQDLRSSLTSGSEREDKEEEYKSGTPLAEMGHEEARAAIDDLREENDALHESMEEAIQLATGMNEKMAKFVADHETSVKDYEAKLASLRQDLSTATALRDEASKTLDALQEENEKLGKDLNEANKLAEASTKLDALQKENEKLVKDLDEANKLVVCSLSDEIKQEQLSETWNREKRELSSAVDSLKRENAKLVESIREMNDLVKEGEECVVKLSEENAGLLEAQGCYEEQLRELKIEQEANSNLRKEIRTVSSEREEAYDTCKTLQREIDQLRESAGEAKGRLEQLHSGSKLAEDDKKRLTELVGANESLTKELKQKNDALQAVRGALESLKSEQLTIKDTIEELRTENDNLRSQGCEDSSEIVALEKRIKRSEKENKGLREANATLSAKLFEEMEKTDALRVANEGLATRICKLVAFIQQTPTAGSGGRANPVSPAAQQSGNSRRRSKSREGDSSRRRSKSRDGERRRSKSPWRD